MKKIICLLLVVNTCQNKLLAQFTNVVIPGSEVRKINSVIVNQEYSLQISLPSGYANSPKKYPVVYLMDAQWDFPLVHSIYGQQYYDGFIPELIIVGVTWGGPHPNPDSLRVRDYTPTKVAGSPQSGGADSFLSFMKKELFPFIETNYRADPARRILMGCSLGGLLTLYTLFTQPDLFTGYAAASPAIGWDKEIIYQYENDFSQKKLSSRVRLYMTSGSVERNRPAYEKFATQLLGRKYPSVSLYSRILENTGHSGTKSETYGRGLQYIFERPRLKLDAPVLNKYTGSYIFPDGNTIQLKNEDNSLVIYFATGNKFPLYAASETDFYFTSEFFNIHFTGAAGKVDGFRLDQFSGTRFIKKTE